MRRRRQSHPHRRRRRRRTKTARCQLPGVLLPRPGVQPAIAHDRCRQAPDDLLVLASGMHGVSIATSGRAVVQGTCALSTGCASLKMNTCVRQIQMKTGAVFGPRCIAFVLDQELPRGHLQRPCDRGAAPQRHSCVRCGTDLHVAATARSFSAQLIDLHPSSHTRGWPRNWRVCMSECRAHRSGTNLEGVNSEIGASPLGRPPSPPHNARG